MKILIVEDEQELREIMAFAIESRVSAQVLGASNGKEAIVALDQNPDIDLVICDYHMPESNGGEVYQHVLGMSKKPKFYLCSTDPPHKFPVFVQTPPDGYFLKPDVIQPILQVLRTFNQNPNKESYVRIPCTLLLKFGILPGDLYLKLGDSRYVKVFNTQDGFELGDLERFKVKNVESLYLKKEASSVYLEELSQNILKISQIKGITAPQSFEIARSTLQMISQFNDAIGMSPEVQKLVKSTVDLTVSQIKALPQLRELFKNIELYPEAYLAGHSIALGYLACDIAAKMKWVSEATFYKLTMAALLHDITLSEDRLARLQSMSDLALIRDQITDEQHTIFADHPVTAAQMAGQIKNILPGVDKIILQHHERPDGTGFPNRTGSSEIQPLSAVFILAHEILNFIYEDTKAKLDFPKYIERLTPRYSKGQFKDILKALSES